MKYTDLTPEVGEVYRPTSALVFYEDSNRYNPQSYVEYLHLDTMVTLQAHNRLPLTKRKHLPNAHLPKRASTSLFSLQRYYSSQGAPSIP